MVFRGKKRVFSSPFAKKSRLKDVQANEVNLFCIEESHQSILEKPMAKKHGTFKEKIKNPPIFFIKNVSYRQKKHKRAIHVDFSRYRYDNIETRPTPTKRIQFNPFVVKSVSESNCKISVKMQYDRTSTSYLTRRWNMNLPFSDATILTKIMNKEISVYKVLHLCLNNV